MSAKDRRRMAAEAREQTQVLRKAVKQAETEVAKLTAERSAIDKALFDPKADQKVGDLMKTRSAVEKKLAAAEAKWFEASEALEAAETPN